MSLHVSLLAGAMFAPTTEATAMATQQSLHGASRQPVLEPSNITEPSAGKGSASMSSAQSLEADCTTLPVCAVVS
jgi:hypothetical protein